jgi:hypothetical protein
MRSHAVFARTVAAQPGKLQDSNHGVGRAVYTGMMTALLLALTLLRPPVEQDTQALQQQVQRLQDELREQQQQLAQLKELLDKTRRDPKSTCAAELRLLRGSEQYTLPAGQASAVPINLLSTVSQPREVCLTEIRITATYIGVSDNLICSGHIAGAARQDQLTQNVNLLIRPWSTREFVLWTNEPPGASVIAKRLTCVTPDGLNEIEVDELQGVASAKVQVTALPLGGGLSTIELRFNRPGVAGR